VINLSKVIIGRAQVKINGEYQSWDSIPSEQQKEIGLKLNDKSLRSVGYKPVAEDKTS
jgi:hypothetical protein